MQVALHVQHEKVLPEQPEICLLLYETTQLGAPLATGASSRIPCVSHTSNLPVLASHPSKHLYIHDTRDVDNNTF
ncbi:hypothetical protein HanXRQr2_Chr12g0554751 [Helianthus annuus]|uniref:Uncharacterized protein n=1 Tax=Helianthus annuus TaxID=4232 RepID=A0A9K3MX63_HELAN|nr:hypothetical protein HanXRQr2_Chr12g0554751 [Helianthus annuus]KAJ0863791.1 hypothetical protein HanPSC8_Chr12g0534161 [Helianthus annuus]